MDEENYTGCLLCIHGIFIPGPYPQNVKCSKLGIVQERKVCELFKTQDIKELDPFDLPKK